ncbi:protein CASP [[Candida] railenensis]|uniref:Protein CASP n=1 Tax=[Candida] railenensis TaxID=45579 RepID=A0A9P0QL38_9ASCO|nr:protein CASP [[Candida] railenensis]
MEETASKPNGTKEATPVDSATPSLEGTPVSAGVSSATTPQPQQPPPQKLVQPLQPGGSTKNGLFSNALQTWTEIDLPSLQRKLDDQGLELKEDQKKSLLNRKDLANKTKEFKKLADEEKLSQFKTLLKSYQNEIDSLTTKKKTVENYFFGIYRLIAEAPDPKPLLEVSLDAVVEYSDAENLKKEVSRLNEELSKKADYDQLKQRLVRNEQKSAEFLSNQLRAKEDEFKALIDEKEVNWAEKEKSFNKQLAESKHKIEELRTSNEVTTLQLKGSGNNEDKSQASASIITELEIVSRDAENSKKRIFELEKRNEKLRSELSKSQNDSELDTLKETFRRKESELEGENALLIANLEQTKKKLTTLVQEQSTKSESYSKQINQLNQELTKLKEKIDLTSDYDELKQENQLLKQLQFGQDLDEDNNEPNEEGENGGNGNDNIDSIIIQRNKALTQELAEFRSQHESFVNRIKELELELNSTSDELAKSQLLNDRLENDLVDLQEVGGAGGSTMGSTRFNDNMSLISGVTKMTNIIGGGNGRRSGSIIGESLTGGSSATMDDSSILPIITKQRDRFRDRNNELEEEIKQQYNTVSDLKRTVNSLKKDNEELYERTRYLASFKDNSASSTFSSRGSNRKLLEPKPNNVTFENPYQANYESKLHPIEQFRVREQERINSKLSPVERLFISFSRAILATRTTRMLFVIYCVGLHFIVMLVTIYSMGLNTQMIPEVGINGSTGGIATGLTGSPDVDAAAVVNPGI